MQEAGLDIYQTYYLDAKQKHLWTDKEVGSVCTVSIHVMCVSMLEDTRKRRMWERTLEDMRKRRMWEGTLEDTRKRRVWGLKHLNLTHFAAACVTARPPATGRPSASSGGLQQGAGQPLDAAVRTHLDPLRLLGAMGERWATAARRRGTAGVCVGGGDKVARRVGGPSCPCKLQSRQLVTY